jgi:hypothetical protein
VEHPENEDTKRLIIVIIDKLYDEHEDVQVASMQAFIKLVAYSKRMSLVILNTS